jgi:ferredoxin
MKLAIVFFSATKNTRLMSMTIKSEFESLGVIVDMFDITALSDRLKGVNFTSYDAVVFGFPVHSIRAPKVVREWLQTIDGKGKKCAMFFTYGGFFVHPAHYSTQQILTKQNFVVVSSAEYPGAHTFNIGGWRAFVGRPNAQDYELVQHYVAVTYRRFTGEDETILEEMEKSVFSEEELDKFEFFRFKVITQLPGRNSAECSMCGICEEACPTGAMNCETGQADAEKCIACLRCVALCPDQVLTINDTTGSWQKKLAMGNTSEAELNNQTGKIYL